MFTFWIPKTPFSPIYILAKKEKKGLSLFVKMFLLILSYSKCTFIAKKYENLKAYLRI